MILWPMLLTHMLQGWASLRTYDTLGGFQGHLVGGSGRKPRNHIVQLGTANGLSYVLEEIWVRIVK